MRNAYAGHRLSHLADCVAAAAVARVISAHQQQQQQQ